MSGTLRILVTAGATREPIDGVRYLSNFSTGRTGAELADAFTRAGHAVTLLAGQGAARPAHPAVRMAEFSDFASLDSRLRAHLGEAAWDEVIHLAAVSDYSVAAIEREGSTLAPDPGRKLGSEAPELTLRLRRNFKLIDRLREYAAAGPGPEPRVTAFKLTQGAGDVEREAAVGALFARGAVDRVVHNDLREHGRPDARGFRLYEGAGREVARAATVAELAGLLLRPLAAHATEGPR